jgi:hypothetical protein
LTFAFSAKSQDHSSCTGFDVIIPPLTPPEARR